MKLQYTVFHRGTDEPIAFPFKSVTEAENWMARHLPHITELSIRVSPKQYQI